MSEQVADDVKDAIRQAGVLGFQRGHEHAVDSLRSDEVGHEVWAALEDLEGVPTLERGVLDFALRVAADSLQPPTDTGEGRIGRRADPTSQERTA